MTFPETSASPASLLVQIDGDAHHGFYLKLGVSVRLKDDERPSLGSYVVVCDRAGRCSLHEAIGITRPRGIRTMKVGPQIEWPSGGRELRQIEDYR